MMYLLDVNALLALGFQQHEFHRRVTEWLRREPPIHLATCSITELGFIRILAQASEYGVTVAEARVLLLRLKALHAQRFTLLQDGNEASCLRSWVKTAKQITDGHLAELAKTNRALLATLDQKIPGAFLIPED
ncbi:MAG: PIN domain-containing protein [Candidatus Angelobacter sp.]